MSEKIPKYDAYRCICGGKVSAVTGAEALASWECGNCYSRFSQKKALQFLAPYGENGYPLPSGKADFEPMGQLGLLVVVREARNDELLPLGISTDFVATTHKPSYAVVKIEYADSMSSVDGYYVVDRKDILTLRFHQTATFVVSRNDLLGKLTPKT